MNERQYDLLIETIREIPTDGLMTMMEIAVDCSYLAELLRDEIFARERSKQLLDALNAKKSREKP